MSNTDRYHLHTNWAGYSAGSNESDTPVQMFERVKIDFSTEGMQSHGDTFFTSLSWSVEQGNEVPDDLDERLQATFAPLFQKFSTYGVPQTTVDGLLTSLKLIPESLKAYIDATGAEDGVFDVQFDVMIEGDDVLLKKTPTEMRFYVAFANRGDIPIELDEEERVLTLFDGWLSIFVQPGFFVKSNKIEENDDLTPGTMH